ncbi:uncharacterized protein EV154DRAFT_257540 [Mucor mucedo]|uniref:uncharacterized protein n=1 Tax=Mucor mucedo TaxID=29922 RepID=UPI002220904E|nr:uncharacterized protein EV154DRAFT_257540 [Mucor mucedo]KAI7896169.1 hypothetical protein EV154DRAFT_257540 [Mucor mucedo]
MHWGEAAVFDNLFNKNGTNGYEMRQKIRQHFGCVTHNNGQRQRRSVLFYINLVSFITLIFLFHFFHEEFIKLYQNKKKIKKKELHLHLYERDPHCTFFFFFFFFFFALENMTFFIDISIVCSRLPH